MWSQLYDAREARSKAQFEEFALHSFEAAKLRVGAIAAPPKSFEIIAVVRKALSVLMFKTRISTCA